VISQKRIKDLGKSMNINIMENHSFDKTNISHYYNIFMEYRLKGYLEADSFDDTIWTLYDRFRNTRSLKFELELFRELNIALKCFALLQISSEFTIHHTQTVVASIKEAIFISKGFSLEALPELEEYINQFGYSKRNNIALYTVRFLHFINHTNAAEFIEKCTPLYQYVQRNRKLPKYEYILLFDDVITDFENTCNEHEHAKYYPVLLWWKITTIIPLRPSEFLLLKKNCITKKQDNSYWITVPREKRKYESYSDIDIENTLQINQTIYELVKTYQDMLPNDYKPNYLMSYETYYKYLDLKRDTYKRDRNVLLLSQFQTLLDDFYKKIVQGKYDYSEVEQVSPGDTRHFAFCNMMLQGFNMLSIAKMGGHRRLRTQQNYWGHIEYFAESWVYVLSENNRLDRLNKSMSDGIFTVKSKLDKHRIYELSDFDTLRPVEYGYCTDSDFPNNCTGDCRFCDFYHFYPKENYTDGTRWLTDCSDLLDRRISDQIKLLEHINQNMKFNLDTNYYSTIDQEELSSTANELNRMMEQKAMVDSLIPKRFEVNQDGNKKK